VWFCCWMIALWNSERGAAEPTDGMKPPAFAGNYWGPAATRARRAGQLPPLPDSEAMARWRSWGRGVLRDGDIVFRLGDARAVRGLFPLSRFIARATGSPFSHTGLVAVEDGSPVVYDCSSAGVQRQPFEVWMLDSVGPLGVKRLKPEHRRPIPGALAYCRAKFEQQVPFDVSFHPDDAALYCVELTEKAFRSQGVPLSPPVRIGEWERLSAYPLTALAAVSFTRLTLDRPVTLEQPVYIPGNDRQGVWASPLLETVVAPEPRCDRPSASSAVEPGCLSLRGDLELAVLVAGELRRSYRELPVRFLAHLIGSPRLAPGGTTLAAQPPRASPRP
jgi:hypothetical protein